MIFTNISWIGDFFMLLPVASWYYKTKNEKIHFVVSKNYYMYEVSKKFIEAQPFTEKVTCIDIGSDAWNQSMWRFNPATYGITGEYLNFGFSSHINEYMSKYYAAYYNLGVDYEYMPTLIPFGDEKIPDKITIEVAHQLNGYWNSWLSMMPSDVTILNCNEPLEKNVFIASRAKERHLGSSSLPILMDMLNLPCNIYAGKGFPEHVFFRNKHTIYKI